MLDTNKRPLFLSFGCYLGVGDNCRSHTVYIDLPALFRVGRDGDVGFNLNHDDFISSRDVRQRLIVIIKRWFVFGRSDGVVFTGFVNLYRLAVK